MPAQLTFSIRFLYFSSTPEMHIFLEQVGVLGCRFVDALSSGKVKQLIQNGERLAWQGIELAVDPATTMALAEVTAHLCHALEELGDSYHPTPRSTRNEQNETTYVDPLQVTDYRSECIENVILSSLGIKNNDEGLPDIADDGSVNSVPSNVAYFQDESTGVGLQDKKHHHENKRDWTQVKNKVNVDLLQDRILHQGRPQARPNITQAMRDTPLATSRLSSSANSVENADTFPDPSKTLSTTQDDNEDESKPPLDMEEVPSSGVLDFDSPGANFDINNPNWQDLFQKIEKIRAMKEEEPSSLQFYRVIYETLLERRREKRRARDSFDNHLGADAEVDKSWSKLLDKAHVRKFRNGKAADAKTSSKATNDQLASLRRLWKYPPWFIYLNAAFLLLVVCLWVGFGLYGMFTVYQVMKYQGTSPANLLHPVQHNHQPRQQMPASTSSGIDSRLIPDQPPKEVVIRIVKEVVHVREDGSTIEQLKNDDKAEKKATKNSLTDLTAEEIEKLLVEDSNGLLNEVLKEAIGDKLNDSTLKEIRDVSTTGDMQKQIDDEDDYSNDHESLTQNIINKLLYRCVV